jgi:uncharacterized repeat protein (TIGR01451 family)
MRTDRIEQLKQKLYSRNEVFKKETRSTIDDIETTVPSGWDTDGVLHIPDQKEQTMIHPLFKKIFAGALIFFFCAMAVAVYMFMKDSQGVSPNNVDMTIVGPVSVASGEEAHVTLSIQNNNSADLKNASLSVEYPEGARAQKDSSQPLVRSKESVGDLKKGETLNRNFTVFLLGDKDAVKNIHFKLEYTVSGSNAVFVKEKDYTVTIGSSPLIMTISSPKETTSGQEVQFDVTVTSNSTATLSNVLVQTEYPYGFTFEDSSLKPVSSDNTVWNIGDIKDGEKKTFSITGTLVAQNNEERTFRFFAGTENPEKSKTIDVVFSTQTPSLVVKRAFIDTTMTIRGSTADVVPVRKGSAVSGTLLLKNSLPDSLSNAVVTMTITGEGIIDKQSVRAGNNGFYQSSNNSIVWDKNSTPSIALISPGNTSSVSFSFDVFPLATRFRNPEIKINTSIVGTRSLDGGDTERVQANISKSVRVSSDLSLVTKSLRQHSLGATGPFPPKVDTPSTFVVGLSLANTYNEISGTQITMNVLPNVEWVGTVSPQNENITYDANTRTITWQPGVIAPAVGYETAPRQIYFVVKVTPTATQIGGEASLVYNIRASAKDNFSGETVTTNASDVTTRAADIGGEGKVTP